MFFFLFLHVFLFYLTLCSTSKDGNAAMNSRADEQKLPGCHMFHVASALLENCSEVLDALRSRPVAESMQCSECMLS